MESTMIQYYTDVIKESTYLVWYLTYGVALLSVINYILVYRVYKDFKQEGVDYNLFDSSWGKLNIVMILIGFKIGIIVGIVLNITDILDAVRNIKGL